MLLLLVAALHNNLTQHVTPLAGIWVKVGYLSQLQSDPAHCAREELHGNMVVEVDMSPISSRIHYLQIISWLES